jgi:hypothetical protein
MRASAVGIATGLKLEGQGVRVRVQVWRRFLLSMSPRLVVGPIQPPIQQLPGVKRPGHEADHSPPTSAKVKNTWIYI